MVSTRTYCKALTLLIVFSMSTIVSFACSLGGFFHSFHHQTSSAAVSSHHDQHGKEQKTGHGHHHEHGDTKHHSHTDENVPVKDECCSNAVAETEKIDKSVSRTIEAPRAVFIASFVYAYSPSIYNLPVTESNFNPDDNRWRALITIPDLRIVIQSFQI